MNAIQMTSTNCAACGAPVIHPWGPTRDFCSKACFRSGRSFCRQCGKPLPKNPNGRFRKAFCSDLCTRKYRRYQGKNPLLSDELGRATCKGCGKSITQNKANTRMFCCTQCCDAYRRAEAYGYSTVDRWGTYAPEVRRILLELENSGQPVTAKRLSIAIDREYKPRRSATKRSQNVTCHCKTCGKVFSRRAWSSASRDYCSTSCQPLRGKQYQPNKHTVLTWEEVDEIRHLYETEQLSQKKLGEKYGTSASNIKQIVNYKTWKTDQDPRQGYVHKPFTVRYGEDHPNSKLTWTQVNEIRDLYESGQLPSTKLAQKYSVSTGTILKIIHYQYWKPDHNLVSPFMGGGQ